MMAFQVFDSAGQGAYFVVLIVAGLFTITTLGLRIYATRLSERKWGLEDWLASAAVAVFLVRVGTVLRCLTILNGRSTALVDDRPAYTAAFQLIFVADMITMLDQSLAKWSICALYYRIFSINRSNGRWIWAIALAQGLVNVALFVVQPLQCRPLHKFWEFWAAGDCMPFANILVGLEPPNSVIDFALVALAMSMVKPLHLKRSAKWRLRALFGLGSVAGILGFVKIGFGYNPDQEYASAAVGLWAVLQSVACIVCCCAPVYKPLLPERSVWGYLSSKLTPSGSSSGGGSGGGGGVWSLLMTRSSRRRGSGSHNKMSDGQGVTSGTLTLDEYQQQGEAWQRHHPHGAENSVNCLVASEGASGQIYPLDSIQVHKSVQVNYDTPSPLEPSSDEDLGPLHGIAPWQPSQQLPQPQPQPQPQQQQQQQQQPSMMPPTTWTEGQQAPGSYVQYVPMWDGRQYVPAVPVWNGQQYYMQPVWNGYQPPQVVPSPVYAAHQPPLQHEGQTGLPIQPSTAASPAHTVPETPPWNGPMAGSPR